MASVSSTGARNMLENAHQTKLIEDTEKANHKPPGNEKS